MKIQRIISILLLCFTAVLTVYADGDNNGSDQDTPPQIVKRKTDPRDPHKPKAPSLVMILFSYDYAAETAHFELPEYVETIDITLQGTQSALTFFGTVSAFNPEWYQPLPAGEYIITCTADTGDIFEGYIYI